MAVLRILLFFLSAGYLSVKCHRTTAKHVCPYEDPDSHECYELVTQNTSCVVMSITGCAPSQKEFCLLEMEYERKACTLYTCSHRGCCLGYVYDEDGICVLQSERSVYCGNGGVLIENNMCLCPQPFSGRRCETLACDGKCQNGGRCEAVDDEPVCICPSAMYSGEFCEKVSCADSCLNGGECIQDGILSRCQCKHGYQGDTCQFPISANCPVRPAKSSAECGTTKNECETDGDCQNGTVCCFNGCYGKCMAPEPKQCLYEGNIFKAGETFSPDPCKKCVCQLWGEVSCTEIECETRQCDGGHEPVRLADHCCKVCPGENLTDSEVPVFTNCPVHFIVLHVERNSDMAHLTDLQLKAVDVYGSSLHVYYNQDKFYHSHDSNMQTNVHIVTAYSECDLYGRRAECSFKVIVRDTFPPVFLSCPTDVYALQDDVISWEEPVISDNVGLSSIKVDGDQLKDKALKVGTYPVSYSVFDYDHNQAMCAFLIRVFDKNTQNAFAVDSKTKRDGLSLGAIVGVSVGLFVAVSLAICLFHAKRGRFIQGSSTSEQNAQTDIFTIFETGNENNASIYQNITKLPNPPDYSLPVAPPSYDEINQLDEQSVPDTMEPPIYEEITNQTPKIDAHYYENIHGQENPAYVNYEARMDYMKI